MRVGHLFSTTAHEEPGTQTWHFMRVAEGSFVPLSQGDYALFFEEQAAWPGPIPTDRWVHLSSIVVRIADGAPRALLREHHTRHRVLASGFLDALHWHKGQGRLLACIDPKLFAAEGDDPSPQRQFDLHHHFVPTTIDVAALVHLLAQRGLPLRPDVG